jgi:hypothetical protein
MTKEQLASQIRCNLFASRDNLDEAFEYAHSMITEPAMLTAMYVVLNTVAKEILKLEQTESV